MSIIARTFNGILDLTTNRIKNLGDPTSGQDAMTLEYHENGTTTFTNKSIDGGSNTFTNIPNSSTTATDANTASAIVARDANGDFSAGKLTLGDSNDNVFLGTQIADTAITTAFDNVCIGKTVARTITEGKWNTVIGQFNGTTLTTGDDNVIIGRGSGQSITTGFRNINIGLTNTSDAGINGAVCIGYNTTATKSNGCFLRHTIDDSSSNMSAWIGDEIVETKILVNDGEITPTSLNFAGLTATNLITFPTNLFNALDFQDDTAISYLNINSTTGSPETSIPSGTHFYAYDRAYLQGIVQLSQQLNLSKKTTAQRDVLPDTTGGSFLYNIDTDTLNYYNETSWEEVVDLTTSQTMSGKTLTSPTLTSPTIQNIMSIQAMHFVGGTGNNTITLDDSEAEALIIRNTNSLNPLIIFDTVSDSITINEDLDIGGNNISNATYTLPKITANSTFTIDIVPASQLGTRTLGIPQFLNSSEDMVLTDATQTLTNKTLTTPIISSISNSGTLSLPTGTDTIVGRDTTDTLTNKTIDGGSNTISGATTITETGILAAGSIRSGFGTIDTTNSIHTTSTMEAVSLELTGGNLTMANGYSILAGTSNYVGTGSITCGNIIAGSSTIDTTGAVTTGSLSASGDIKDQDDNLIRGMLRYNVGGSLGADIVMDTDIVWTVANAADDWSCWCFGTVGGGDSADKGNFTGTIGKHFNSTVNEHTLQSHNVSNTHSWSVEESSGGGFLTIRGTTTGSSNWNLRVNIMLYQ